MAIQRQLRKVLLTVGIVTLLIPVVVYVTDRTSQNIKRSSLKETINKDINHFRLQTEDDVMREVRHIGFLKVHKAASSTMQNIFFRFGMRRNLTFVFTTNPNYFSRRSNSTYSIVKPTKRDGHDILCVHGVFNETAYADVLPDDSVYIGIVRDPVTVFISAVNYYSQKNQMLSYLARTPGNKLRNLIEHPEKYDTSFFSYTKNVMARDFGFNESTDPTVFKTYLMRLAQKFRLVMIAEYFDESLVLMRRLLHWKMKDILYIPSNVFHSDGYSLSDLNETHINLLRKRNQMDFSIYKVFYHKFWEIFHKQDQIHGEVLKFKEILVSVETFCNRIGNKGKQKSSPKGHPNKRMEKRVNNDKETLKIAKTRWNEGFVVSEVDCELMTKEELKFIKLLRRIQGSVINETLY